MIQSIVNSLLLIVHLQPKKSYNQFESFACAKIDWQCVEWKDDVRQFVCLAGVDIYPCYPCCTTTHLYKVKSIGVCPGAGKWASTIYPYDVIGDICRTLKY